MYQEILFVNQEMYVFLNQEERLQFLIISVSERDWKRQHKSKFKMASNRFYIPNVNEFFEGLISLLQQRGDCVKKNTDGGWGDAEFLARRLEPYKRILRVIYGRVRSRPRTTAPESTYSWVGTFNTDINELQITITCDTKQWLSLWRQYTRVKYYAEFTVE